MHRFLRVAGFIVHHKYAVVLIVFVLVIGFTDSNSLLMRYKLRGEIARTQAKIDDYDAHYERDCKTLDMLNNDPRAMQRIARERYLMKKPNEDVYVVE